MMIAQCLGKDVAVTSLNAGEDEKRVGISGGYLDAYVNALYLVGALALLEGL